MTLVHDVIASGAPKRWVMMLHGLGDSKEGWKPVAEYLTLADTGWIFVQAPDCYYDGWSWFDLRLPDPRPDLTTVHRSRDLLRALLVELETTRGIRCEDLTLMGFSQGCLMTMAVALTHDRPFAGVVGVSGWVAEIEGYPTAFGAAIDRQRILMTHGTADPVIPITVTRPQAARLQALGLDLTWREYPKAHGLDTETEITDMRAFIAGR